MTIDDLFTKGGFVVWILAGYSLVVVAVLTERLLTFALAGQLPHDFETGLVQALRRNQASEYLQSLRGPEVTMVQGLVAAAAAGVKDLGQVASRIGSAELQRLERGFRTLGILGNTAPLLGLFGTITGMIQAFMVIEQAGGRVEAHALAGGIWEAMLTTGVGLAVAIPTLLMLHVLEGLADSRVLAMRNCASLTLEQLHGHVPVETGEPAHHRDGVVHAV